MLYDPKWNETKADPFSLESLIAWLEKQPATTAYDYCDPGHCLVGQYLRDQGAKKIMLMSGELRAIGWRDLVNPRGSGHRDEDWTFGAALTRARAELAKRG